MRLAPTAYPRLAAALGDVPETVIPLHQLTRHQATADLVGRPDRFRAVIIQATDAPGEPAGFGRDPVALWTLLQALRGWFCINVPAPVAPPLADLIAADTALPVRRYGDRHFVLPTPAPTMPHPAVRLLAVHDLARLAAAPPSLQPTGWGGPAAALTEGVVAGAIVDEQLVAISAVSARSARYADIRVATLAAWRGRGLATAAAALVARQVQQAGLTPIWSTGEDNHASLAIARRLGGVEVGRRVYVIPERAE